MTGDRCFSASTDSLVFGSREAARCRLRTGAGTGSLPGKRARYRLLGPWDFMGSKAQLSREPVFEDSSSHGTRFVRVREEAHTAP